MIRSLRHFFYISHRFSTVFLCSSAHRIAWLTFTSGDNLGMRNLDFFSRFLISIWSKTNCFSKLNDYGNNKAKPLLIYDISVWLCNRINCVFLWLAQWCLWTPIEVVSVGVNHICDHLFYCVISFLVWKNWLCTFCTLKPVFLMRKSSKWCNN